MLFGLEFTCYILRFLGSIICVPELVRVWINFGAMIKHFLKMEKYDPFFSVALCPITCNIMRVSSNLFVRHETHVQGLLIVNSDSKKSKTRSLVYLTWLSNSHVTYKYIKLK